MHETVTEMLQSSPKGPFVKQGEVLAKCIDACFHCAQTCAGCADACLSEENVSSLTRCIRLDLDCSDICLSTGRLLTRQHQPDMNLLQRMLELCELACRTCADECDEHAQKHEHCKICAAACRQCERACRELLDACGEASAAKLQ